MRLLALDPSTTTVGWCVAIDGEYHESGVYKPRGRDAWARIEDYEDWLMSWFQRGFLADTVPDALATELATGNRGNMRTNRLLGAVEYVTRKTAGDYGVPLVTVTASQVRASGCHKGALAVASAIAGRDVTSGDEADAIGVMLAGWGKWKADKIGV